MIFDRLSRIIISSHTHTCVTAGPTRVRVRRSNMDRKSQGTKSTPRPAAQENKAVGTPTGTPKIPEVKFTDKQIAGQTIDKNFAEYKTLRDKAVARKYDDEVFSQVVALAVQGWSKLENRCTRIKGGKGSPAWEDETLASLKSLQGELEQAVALLTLIAGR